LALISFSFVCAPFLLFSQMGDLKERLSAVQNYLQQTPIEEQFKELCTELLAANKLPYNPYPWLVNKFQIIAQR